MERAAEIEEWRRGERARLIGLRLALTPEERQRASAAIEERFWALLARRPGRIIGLYWPVKGEFDPRPLAERLAATGRAAALPAVTGAGAPLEYRRWQEGAPMERGAHGIAEPRERDLVRPEILLVPLVGFDEACHRLGYGGGYFDRTLAALTPPPVTIGIGFELGRLATIGPQAHDIALDFIVTEARLREARPQTPLLKEAP
ncbi:MAG TPA: 5-formyltetrahydrofolate cyclo-ligase [Stellaceae bacterium]|nr:5-formyltetrahydrofolate cyclo-ligase [Stellaceae bacterium]